VRQWFEQNIPNRRATAQSTNLETFAGGEIRGEGDEVRPVVGV